MGDIATAAKMSRPALYLVFQSKEEIFTAVKARITKEILADIAQGLGQIATAEKKLIFAFELWTVKPFEVILSTPDSRDLYEGGFEFAGDIVPTAFINFEALVAQVLEPLVKSQTNLKLTSAQIAHLLVGAVAGYKQASANGNEFRELIKGLITLTLASLQDNKSAQS